MATMNLSLPNAMKEWIEAQARNGGYSDVSDYVRDLARRDQERGRVIAELQTVISQGIDSGVSENTMGDILVAARAAARDTE